MFGYYVFCVYLYTVFKGQSQQQHNIMDSTYLTESVNRSRINSALAFDTSRISSISSETVETYAPEMDVKHIGGSKYLVRITSPSHYCDAFDKQFTVEHVKEFYHVEVFTDKVLYVCCSKPIEWVKREIREGFLPF